MMRYYLAGNFVLKRLETPSLYNISNDELYELDETAFEFLKKCARTEGCDAGGADKEFIGYCVSEGVLSAERQSKSFTQFIPLKLSFCGPSLRYLELQITDKCNLKCKHCYIDQGAGNELPVEIIRNVLDEFESMQGLRLLITGGEPLMRGDFGAVNALLPLYGFRKILFTNGLLLDKALLEKLNVDEIQFSVDGMEQGHDALRGKGTYKKVMRALEISLVSGITVSIATMVHSRNIGEFAVMEKLFRGMGIEDWTVDVPCVTGHLKHNTFFHVPADVAGQYLNYGFGGGIHGGGEGYACGLHLLSVLANGTVAKCAFYSHSPLGTVSEGLGKCREGLKPVKLESLQCAALSCRAIDSCRGGCRYRASIGPDMGAGEQTGRDIYKCFSYDIIKGNGS
ncbi:MAG: radical SAM protein [Nitrospirae bacterium]|nr:radical SAM protein [Nitrospirota bacterium]